MNALKHHSGIPAFLGLTTLAALYIIASPGFTNDWALDPLTGLVAVIAALLACSQMAQVSSSRWTGRLWAGVVAVLALVCGANFFESSSDRLGEYFGSDDLDDYLLLLAGPCLIFLAHIGAAPRRAKQAACAGLALQVAAAAFDLLAGAVGLVEPPAVWPLLTDSAELLSASLYLLAVFHITFDAARALSPFEKTAQALPRHGISIRDRLYPPPFVLGWNLPPENTPAGRVHRLCNQALWPVGDVTISALNLVLIALWPFIAAVRATEQVRRNGDAVTRVTGKSRARQFLEQWKLAVSLRISPQYYYIYEFYLPHRLKSAAEYLMRYEAKEIAYRCLYPVETEHSRLALLKNKAAFARHCSKHQLKHVPTLFVFEGGLPFNAALPAFDLFVKPVQGKGGFGAERWRLVAPGRYDNGRGRELGSNELLMHLRELSRFAGSYIVQPVLQNHRILADLTPGALCTARMLTCRNENGGYELTDAAFRMPVDARSEVDNFHAGGIAASIDLRTGTLGPATHLRTMGTVWYDRHPATDARITGRQLPMWQEAVSLVKRAHGIFPDYALVGWDVAFLEDGPILIEGNRGPDIDIHQRTSKRPMGNTRFGALLAYNLEIDFRQRGAL